MSKFPYSWECQECWRLWKFVDLKKAVSSKEWNPDVYEWQLTGQLVCECHGDVHRIQVPDGYVFISGGSS